MVSFSQTIQRGLLGLMATMSVGLSTAQNTTTAKANPNEVKIAVFAINDFHAGFVRNDAKYIPGAAAIVETMDSLKRVYPYHTTVSAGDAFGGSYFYNMSRENTLLPQFFKDLGISISAIGNHEFDEGQEKLAAKWSDTNLCPLHFPFNYVSANIRNMQGKSPSFAQPFAVVEIPISKEKKVDVAFIGLSTADTPWQASARRVAGLHFDSDYPRVLDSLKHTPGYEQVANADLRFILTHIGTAQNGEQVKWTDGTSRRLNDINDPAIHGFFTSHSHEKVCGYVNNRKYAIVQGQSHGNYISMMEVAYDTLANQVISVTPRLVRVTPKATLSPKAKRLQAQIDEVLTISTTPGGTSLSKAVIHLDEALQHNRKIKYTQTKVGSLVCESYSEAFRKVAGLSANDIIIGVSHFGSIRAGFPKGDISVLDVGETLPFANGLRIYHLSGKQLYDLIDFGLHNRRYGQIQTSYLKYITDKKGNLKKLLYVNGNIEKAIDKKKKYYMVVDDYITHGGDGYAKEFFPEAQELKEYIDKMPLTTDAFIEYLTKKGKK